MFERISGVLDELVRVVEAAGEAQQPKCLQFVWIMPNITIHYSTLAVHAQIVDCAAQNKNKGEIIS